MDNCIDRKKQRLRRIEWQIVQVTHRLDTQLIKNKKYMRLQWRLYRLTKKRWAVEREIREMKEEEEEEADAPKPRAPIVSPEKGDTST